MKPVRLFSFSLALSSVLLLAACESDEDKAERYLQSGLKLIEQGDNERALLELRNVFLHDGFNREAREAYAGLLKEMGRTKEAYGQYLRLIEQYPDAVEARIALAEMAVDIGNSGEVERHATAAIELVPDRPDAQALGLLLKYRQARISKDTPAAAEFAAQANELLAQIRAEGPEDNDALVSIVLDDLIVTGTKEETLAFVETAIERSPQNKRLNVLKAQLLEQSGDVQATGEQLKNIIALFPEDGEIKQVLINWYLRQDDVAGAESFLRAQAGPDTGPTEGHVAVIQLLGARTSREAALAEIERLEAANAGTDNEYFYATLRVVNDYQQGNIEPAIAELETLIEKISDGAQKIDMQVQLAQMLMQQNQTDKVDSIVGTILEADPSNVPALKLQAFRLISKDQPGEAIVALRRALSQNPRDVETLTIMAEAHQRDGDTDLAGERLALAVEVSRNGATESMRYAQFLITQGRRQIAATVLDDARTSNPRNAQVLGMLANLYLQDGAWQEAQNITNALRALNTPDTDSAATELQAAILQGQDRLEDSLGLLESQLTNSEDQSDTARTRAIVLVVQTQIRGGKIDAARTSLDQALADAPDNPSLRMLSATLHALDGDFQTAEDGYRALITEFPQSVTPVRVLMNLLSSQGRTDEANAVLQEALERAPEDPTLLFFNAGYQERIGDIEGAIATYETLYAQNSGNLIIANNLASLISAHRDDSESLTRAAVIARRLRGTEVAAFQDTYGWIAYRRGNLDEALEYLEPAAAGLANDPFVQFHLGMTYTGLKNTAAAKEQLERALTLWEGRDVPQIQIARDTLATLSQEEPPLEN